MDIHIASYISTPSELDAAANTLDRNLSVTASPQKKFLLIVQFFANTRALPEDWLRTYLLFLAPTFVDLCVHPAVRSFAPGVWKHAFECLLTLERMGYVNAALESKPVRRVSAIKMVLSYAYLGDLRAMHTALEEAGLTTAGLSEQTWSTIFSAGTTEHQLFLAYADSLGADHGEAVSIVRAALSEWQRYRDRDGAMSIVLLEEDDLPGVQTGRIVLMDILLAAEAQGTAQLSNRLDIKASSTVEQIERAQSLAIQFIAERTGKKAPAAELHAYIHETEAALRGGSLGFACTVGMIARYSRLINGRIVWNARPTVAFVGSVLSSGTLDVPPWSTIEKKIRVAFYSGIEKIVIPAAHRETAMYLVQSLQRSHPNRTLQVVGASHFSDCFRIPGLIDRVERTRTEMLLHTIRKHSTLLLITFAVLFFGGGGFFAYKAFFVYPDLERMRGLRVEQSSIVYNPRDSLEWCFRDYNVVKDRHIPFGDLELGDGFTRSFTIWNMTPFDLPLHCSLEGPDASDWYINFGDGDMVIPEAASRQVTVMFAPRSAGQGKTARFVLRGSDGDGGELFSLDFSGAAGKPLPGGYALRLDGQDDQMFFGQQSTAFDVQEGTFECWYKADTLAKGMLFFNGHTESDGTKHESVFLGFWRRDAAYYRVGAEVGYLNLPREDWLEPGTWVHFALGYSVPKKQIRAYVNGRLLSEYNGRFILPGIGMPFVTLGVQNDMRSQKLFTLGELDEVRFWHSLRTGEEIRRNMHRPLTGKEPDIAGYWDMDPTVEAYVFNGNKLAHNAELLNRPAIVRSDAPIKYESADCRLTTTPSGSRAVELMPGRYLLCARNPLPRYGDATFAFTFRQDPELSFHFNYLLQEKGWISVESNSVFTSGVGDDPKHFDLAPGWHTGICTVDRNGRLLFYVDGAPIDTSITWRGGQRDWYHRFEGILLGFRADKQNLPGPWNYNWFFPYLNHPRAYGDLRIWSRVLREQEIREYAEQGIVPRNRLVAEWVLDSLPDTYKNYSDRVQGLLLHIKEVRTWK